MNKNTYQTELLDFINLVINRVHLMKKKQLNLFIINYFKEYNLKPSYVDTIIYQAQLECILFITIDGYVVSKKAYISIYNTKWYDDADYLDHVGIKNKLPEGAAKRYSETIDCLWMVAESLYASKQAIRFEFCHQGPWMLQYIMPADENNPARFYQVTKISRGNEVPMKIAIEDDTRKILVNDADNEYLNYIRRVVILDDENVTSRVPRKCGVSLICSLDEKFDNNLKLLIAIDQDGTETDYRQG